MKLTRYDFIFLAIILAVVAVIGVSYRSANPGLYDDGLLQLAGATSLLRDGSYDIIQRPPLYSAFLAVLAAVQGVSPQETQPLAQELGSILFHDVATPLLATPFLTSVLLVNLLLWILTAVLLLALLRNLGLSPRWQFAALLLMLVPSTWQSVSSVSEVPLCAFLLAAGTYTLTKALVDQQYRLPIFIAGNCFALAGLTRATYQLLPIAICLILFVVLRKRLRFNGILRNLFVFLLPYLVFIGGFSFRNNVQYGFWGVSGISGVALSTRTAEYLDRASAAFPEEVVTFSGIRDQLYLELSNKNDVVYWGARASNWLMSNRSMSYLEANRFLFSLNLQAVRAAPLNYVDTVAASFVHFHFPVVNAEWGTAARLGSALLEFGLIGAFVGVAALWGTARTLSRLRWFTLEWHVSEFVIALSLLMFWYTALISSAIDVGKPEHRMPVQFIVALVIVVGAHWLYTRTKRDLS